MTTKNKEVAAKPQNTSMAALHDQLKSQALAQQETSEAVGGTMVKASHTGFTIPGGDEVPAPLSVVVLGYVSKKSYYDKPYNPNEIHAPACAAIGPGTFDSLVPSEGAPNAQNPTCKGCPLNEFGTSNTGKGKMCSDNKLIAFMLPDAEPNDPVYTASISPSGLKDFNHYLGRLNNRYGLPTVAFISELSIKPAGASVTISIKEKEQLQDPAKLGAFMGRQEEAMKMLLTPIVFDFG